MYYSLLIVIGVSMMISFISAGIIITFNVSEGQKNMLAFMLTCAVSCFGYFLDLISKSEDAIFNAIRFEYMGTAFMMLFFCEYIYYYVGAKKPSAFFKFLGFFDYFILTTMWFSNHIPFFFQGQQLKHIGIRYYLEIEYGIGFYLYLVFSFVIPTFLAIKTLYMKAKEHHVKSYLMINLLFAILILVPAEYIISRFIPGTKYYDFSLGFITIMFFETVIAGWRFGNYEINKLSMKTVINEINDVMLVINDSGYIVDCNESANRVLKLKPGMYIQDEYSEFEALSNTSNEVYEVISNKTLKIGDFIFDLHAKEILNKKGNLEGYILLMTDVTDLLNQMEELKVLKEKAEEANKAKTLFLSNMSHEIRTPMNSIMGITEVLLREDMSHQDREYLLNIRNSGNSLISIINDILDFSKVESGIFEILEKEYDPIAMINDLGLMFMSRIGEKTIELLFYIDSNLPKKLFGDEVRVRQIIINIVNNAIKYTEEGCIELFLRYDGMKNDKGILAFQVKDTGCGIAEKDMPKLFMNFGRIENDQIRQIEGTGLGLPICKAYVEKMGGNLWVDSKVGIGSVFSFTIPQGVMDDSPAIWLDEEKKKTLHLAYAFQNPILKRYYYRMAENIGIELTDLSSNPYSETMYDYLFTDSEYYQSHMVSNVTKNTVVIQNVLKEKAPEKGVLIAKKPFYVYPFCMILNGVKEKIETNEQQNHSFSAPMARILLVDDNEMNRKVAIDLLKPLQMKIDTAVNGEEAVFLYENRHYDLILMDHMMPVMDGLEATEKIREIENGKSQIPIIALTANAVLGAKDKMLEAGMNDFVTKPIALKDLYEVLYKWLPNDKIVLCEYSEKKNENADFKEKKNLEKAGFDVKNGLFYCGTVETYIEILKDFYTTLPYKIDLIKDYESKNLIKEYVVEVHSMKTSLKTVGRTSDSEYFLEMEMAGKNGNEALIHEKTDEYLDVLRKIHTSLSVMFDSKPAELKEVSKETICSVLSMILEALEVFDFDAVDSFMSQLNTYRFPQECLKDLEKLRIFVADVSYGNVKDTVMKLMKELEK